jgi:translation initiation factor 1
LIPLAASRFREILIEIRAPFGIPLPAIVGLETGRIRGKEDRMPGRRNEPLLVYSTDRGLVCPNCRHPVAKCSCGREAPAPKGDGIVRVRRETKGRGGKTVTTAEEVPLSGEALRQLCAELKRRCGTGGTIKEGVIQIQGDHRETVLAELSRRGFTVKPAGG